jgi:hypothetical protein
MPDKLSRQLADEDLITPEHLLHAARDKKLFDAIFAPITPLLPAAQAFLDKPLGQSTGAEAAAFAACVAYALAVGFIGGRLFVALAVATAGAASRGRVTAVRVPLQLR